MIKYSLMERVNPIDLAAPKKFFPVKQAQEELTLRDFAKRISRESTVSTMDAMAVLEGLLQIIPDEIANGKIIKLGDFGTFRSTLSAEGADTAPEFTVSKIKSLNVRFRPAREFRNLLANVKYEQVS
ncbi:MAG: HU family DNA-binding protein [Lutibacter sp.]|jgi:predicted histone-like DNA-binding protein|uniref:HU family DNA-binding protein n=1 Tax=Lutibacter sp. TaxID=1925666 RepID=UPI00299D763C|nr:HU family DNA-binding protein [Lutibacter sp.]MDX1828794.1 HU family DNA-binding protein [Lutibacter sp.]